MSRTYAERTRFSVSISSCSQTLESNIWVSPKYPIPTFTAKRRPNPFIGIRAPRRTHPAHPNTEPRLAYEDGKIADYLMYQHKNAWLVV